MSVIDLPRTDLGALVFAGVSKTFPTGATALDEIDLRVEPGEFLTVVGPSGCGKSTLLRLAAGLTRPSAGYVEVPNSTPGVVFQDANLLPWRSVLANVELADELDKIAKQPRRERARAALDAVGLSAFESYLPGRLSGGMRMRVSIARALVSQPAFLLFDEPFGALDEITRLALQDELARIVSERSVAALFITHSVTEAVYLGTRVAVMSARPGRIIADIPVGAAAPRAHDFRFTEQFTQTCAHVSDALAGGHA